MEHNNNQREYLNLLSENDFDYLLDKSRWIEKLLYRIHLAEVKPLLRETLEEIMQELERNGKDIPGNVIEKICNRKQDGKYLFGKELPPAVQPDFALRAAPLPAAPAATTTTTASNLSTATTLKMPHTTIKANDSPLDVQSAETKLKFFFEQFVDHQRYYVKYFQFVAACNQEDYDLADSLYEELIAIDPKGEDKIAYKDPAAFQAGMKECIVLVDQLDEYYKSPVHANERLKALFRRKELKAEKEKFQEALARVTPGSSSSSFSAQV